MMSLTTPLLHTLSTLRISWQPTCHSTHGPSHAQQPLSQPQAVYPSPFNMHTACLMALSRPSGVSPPLEGLVRRNTFYPRTYARESTRISKHDNSGLHREHNKQVDGCRHDRTAPCQRTQLHGPV